MVDLKGQGPLPPSRVTEAAGEDRGRVEGSKGRGEGLVVEVPAQVAKIERRPRES